ncbi:MAG: SHOCT domain-containing protein [Acidaminobacteraceae bacterium]
MFGRGYGGGFEGMGHFNGGFEAICMIIFVLIAALLVYFLLKKKNDTNNVDSDILEILKRKYVDGEITEEEYVQKKNVLTNKKHL